MKPTLLLNATNKMRVAQEEIFVQDLQANEGNFFGGGEKHMNP